jgi:hypothetical protein
MSCATSTSGTSVVSPRRRHALHVAQDALDHLLEVGLALAQVLVLHVVELARDDFVLRGQRPLGVVVAVGDPVLHAADQLLVLQQHQVHVQQRGEFVRRVLGQILLHARDFFHHRVARHPNARDLVFSLGGLDEIVRHVGAAGRHQHGTAYRDSPRDGQTVD